MTTRPNELPRPVEAPAQEPSADMPKVQEVTLRAPLRLLVLEEATGIPLVELEQRSGIEIRQMLQAFPANLEGAVQRVLDRELGGQQPPEPPGRLNLPASQAELQNRIDEAYQFLSHRYTYHAYLGGPYDFEKEYAGFPVGITTPSLPNERMLGQGTIVNPPIITPYGLIYNVSIGQTWCFQDVSFEDGYDWDYGEPDLWVDRYYSISNNGQVTYNLSVRSFGGANQVDLYRGSELGQGNLVLADLKNQPLPQSFGWTAFWGAGWPASRYTARHAHLTTWKAYDANNDGRAWWLWHLGADFGFYLDIYDPMFNYSIYWPQDRWCFDPDAYHDCGVVGSMPKKLGGSWKGMYYPYESKVCIFRGSCGLPGSYIWLSQRDRLVRILQAIHILVKYGNPDYSYLDPKDDGSYTTPRQVARDMEQNCSAGGPNPASAYGINVYGQDASYASGVRTNAFTVLETLLGYKHGDTTSRTWADRMADVLIQVQWGSPPFPQWQGETSDHGLLTRGPYRGGALLGWKPGSGFQWSLPPKSWLSAIMDMFSMPSEDEDFIPSNVETTATYLQALRVYLRYKYGAYYPTNKWLP